MRKKRIWLPCIGSCRRPFRRMSSISCIASIRSMRREKGRLFTGPTPPTEKKAAPPQEIAPGVAPPDFLRRFCLVLNHFLEELKKEPDSGCIKPQTLGRVAILQENPDFSKMQNCERAFLPLFGTTHTRSMYAHARRKGVCFRRIPPLFIIFSRFHARRRTPCAHVFPLAF